jgi:hypothetical protein
MRGTCQVAPAHNEVLLSERGLVANYHHSNMHANTWIFCMISITRTAGTKALECVQHALLCTLHTRPLTCVCARSIDVAQRLQLILRTQQPPLLLLLQRSANSTSAAAAGAGNCSSIYCSMTCGLCCDAKRQQRRWLWHGQQQELVVSWAFHLGAPQGEGQLMHLCIQAKAQQQQQQQQQQPQCSDASAKLQMRS